MNLNIRDQVKMLLLQEHIMMKDLAKDLGKRLNKKYTLENLSQKLRKGTFSYNEMMIIADILGYNVEYKKRQES